MQLRITIILFLLNFCLLKGQVNEVNISSDQDLIISDPLNNKIPVFVFVRDENDYDINSNDIDFQKMNYLLDILKNKNIDFDLFEIFLIKIKKMKVCPPNKIMDLYNYDSLVASFIYEPYRILIKAKNNSNLDSILNLRLNKFNSDDIINVKNIKFDNSPFIQFNDYINLSILLTKPTAFQEDFLKLKRDFDSLKLVINSINKKMEFNNRFLNKRHKYISLLSSPFGNMNQYNLFNSDILGLSQKKINGLELNYTDYFIGNKNKIGILIGVSHSSISGIVKFKNSNTTIQDVVKINDFDENGDLYNRIAYSSGNVESFNFKNLGLFVGVSFKENLSKKSSIVFSTSLKFNNFYYSKYQSIEGNVSFGGIYPQYNPNDTMFSGQFDFYKNKSITNKRQDFLLNSFNISTVNSLFYSHSIFTSKKSNELLFNIGFNSEISSVILSNSNHNKHQISNDLDAYNSMLYRIDNINLRNINFILGLSLIL